MYVHLCVHLCEIEDTLPQALIWSMEPESGLSPCLAHCHSCCYIKAWFLVTCFSTQSPAGPFIIQVFHFCPTEIVIFFGVAMVFLSFFILYHLTYLEQGKASKHELMTLLWPEASHPLHIPVAHLLLDIMLTYMADSTTCSKSWVVAASGFELQSSGLQGLLSRTLRNTAPFTAPSPVSCTRSVQDHIGVHLMFVKT